MRIIFATGNENKLREIREIMGDIAEDVVSMREAGVFADPEENGKTFEENARIKALACAQIAIKAGLMDSDTVIMADDSGLEIDALGGEPGIYSARYMGHDTPYTEKNRALLKRLENVKDEERTARFVCAVAAVVGKLEVVPVHDGKGLNDTGLDLLIARETMEGRIAREPAGENGFGYDPIFFLPEYGKTSAELSPDEKNAISHRGKALRMMREELKKLGGAGVK